MIIYGLSGIGLYGINLDKIMKKITVAKGNGIGPEIMDATLNIILAAGARIKTDEIEVGEKVYLSGNISGIAKASWESVRSNKVFLNTYLRHL